MDPEQEVREDALGMNRRVRAGVTVSALCQAALGALLLFAPLEVSSALMPTARADGFPQLLGAALIGFAAMNWIARGAALGGIYGRAVVIGNQTHFVVGALVLLNRGLDEGGNTSAYWVLAGLYALGAAFFVSLAFFSTGLPKK